MVKPKFTSNLTSMAVPVHATPLRESFVGGGQNSTCCAVINSLFISYQCEDKNSNKTGKPVWMSEYYTIMTILGSGDWLTALTALSGDLGLVSNTHIKHLTIYNFSSKILDALF